MYDILKILDDATDPGIAGPGERQAAGELEPMMQKVKELTSESFTDRLEELAVDIVTEESDEHFARGFRLGVQLMLAAALPSSFSSCCSSDLPH